jgi:hypothetical protein
MRQLRAPALECANCHVLHLEETAVRSGEERDSVRLAVAQRARVYASTASQTPTTPETASWVPSF